MCNDLIILSFYLQDKSPHCGRGTWTKTYSVFHGWKIGLLFLVCERNHIARFPTWFLVLLFLGVQSEFFCNCLAGPRFNYAFQDPGEYLAIEPLFEVISFLGRNKFQWNCSHGLSSFFCLISFVSLVCIHYVLLIGDRKRDILWHIIHQKVKYMHCSKIRQSQMTF